MERTHWEWFDDWKTYTGNATGEEIDKKHNSGNCWCHSVQNACILSSGFISKNMDYDFLFLYMRVKKGMLRKNIG
jgi:hypothetical protein